LNNVRFSFWLEVHIPIGWPISYLVIFSVSICGLYSMSLLHQASAAGMPSSTVQAYTHLWLRRTALHRQITNPAAMVPPPVTTVTLTQRRRIVLVRPVTITTKSPFKPIALRPATKPPTMLRPRLQQVGTRLWFPHTWLLPPQVTKFWSPRMALATNPPATQVAPTTARLHRTVLVAIPARPETFALLSWRWVLFFQILLSVSKLSHCKNFKWQQLWRLSHQIQK
jgi:hypothetical protein